MRQPQATAVFAGEYRASVTVTILCAFTPTRDEMRVRRTVSDAAGHRHEMNDANDHQ